MEDPVALRVKGSGNGTKAAWSMDLLPNEIIAHIIEALIPEPPEIGETRPVAFQQLQPEEPWYDFIQCRRALNALCHVSRLYKDRAQRSLFNTVAILDIDGLVLLFRTLLELPQYGEWVGYLSCHLTLSADEVIREMRRAVARRLKSFQPTPADLQTENTDKANRHIASLLLSLPHIDTGAGDFDDMPQVFLSHVVNFLPNLHTVLLQLPVCDDDPEYEVLFGRVTGHEFTTRGQEFTSSSRPFQKVKTLLLQGDPDMLEELQDHECNCRMPHIWGCQARQYWPIFKIIPNLETVEIFGDDGLYSIRVRQDDEERPKHYFGSIKHLYLHNSCASPQGLQHAMKNAPSLETIYMTPRTGDAFYRPSLHPEDESRVQTLNSALRKKADSLRQIDVAWHDLRGYSTFIGPEGRLAALPQMAKLESLCIQLDMLYGFRGYNVGPPLANRLPPSLVELTVEDWWWKDVDSMLVLENPLEFSKRIRFAECKDYRGEITELLMDFAAMCPERLPKLRKFTFMSRIPSTWNGDDDGPLIDRFIYVKNAFEKSNIEFNVDEI